MSSFHKNMFGKMLLLVSWIIWYCVFYCFTSQNIDFPSELNFLCPHSSFCEQETLGSSTSDKNERWNQDIVPCCSSCSCAKDCGRKRNCCKYEYDVYKLDETLDTICKQLCSGENVPSLPYYHIIDKCPNRSEVCSSGKDNYVPVYSKDSGMLYYNKHCAQCHKQWNIVTFNPVLMCEHQFISYFGFSRNEDTTTHGCFLNFVPPDGLNMTTELCYPYKINKCELREEVYEGPYSVLCKAFNATFQTPTTMKYMFNNVFCYLCLTNRHNRPEYWLESFEFCPVDNRHKLLGEVSFAVILESSTNSLFEKHGDHGIKGGIPEWCKRLDSQEDCRPLFCPEGQTYQSGKCKYVGDQWYFKMLRINVKLLIPAETKNNIQTELIFENLSNVKRVYLERPELQDLQLTLSCNLDSNNVSVRFFLAMLHYERKTVNPRVFLNRIDRSLRGHWKLYLDRRVYNLIPKLNRYLRYSGMNSDTDVYLPQSFMNGEITTTREIEERIIFVDGPLTLDALDDYTLKPIFITKLFFCNLVEVYDHEFDVSSVQLAFINTSIKLEDGEFSWVNMGDGRYKGVICLVDHPDYTPRASNTGHISKTPELLTGQAFMLVQILRMIKEF